jgi:hypothetical protein
VREGRAFALLILFTLVWAASSAFEFHLTTQNSDCSYTAAEDCSQTAKYEQRLIIWRGLALELAAVLAFLGIRKR